MLKLLTRLLGMMYWTVSIISLTAFRVVLFVQSEEIRKVFKATVPKVLRASDVSPINAHDLLASVVCFLMNDRLFAASGRSRRNRFKISR